MWVIGQPETGKSRALEAWATYDMKVGNGICVIDPHSDLFDHLVKRAALVAQGDTSLADRVVIINPLDPKWTVGFNPLQMFSEMPSERLAWILADVAAKIWKIDTSVATRMVWLMVHTFLALSELGLTLVELPYFLRNHQWRNEVVRHLRNEEVREYFLLEFPKDRRLRVEWTQSTLNKMGAFVMDPDIRLIVGQRTSTINFREIMDQKRILLVNIPKGQLGEENSQLLGAFIVAQIQHSALSRGDTYDRPPFYLYLDEFQNYTTDHIQEILSESRKYGLSLVLAHQYLEQLPKQQKQAVANTAGTVICFRVGRQDAEVLAGDLFTPDIDPKGHKSWSIRRIGRSSFLLPSSKARPLSNEWERYIQKLTGLKNREFWVKRRKAANPVKQYSLDMPAPSCPPEKVARLEAISGARYGRMKQQVRRELEENRPQLLSNLAAGSAPGHGNYSAGRKPNGTKRTRKPKLRERE
jgi:hypothetical protein